MTRKRKDRPGEAGRNEKDSGTMPPREIGRAAPEGGGASDKGSDFPVTDDDQNFFA